MEEKICKSLEHYMSILQTHIDYYRSKKDIEKVKIYKEMLDTLEVNLSNAGIIIDALDHHILK
jgi:hypothetical protein